jgi:hypothetical protein
VALMRRFLAAGAAALIATAGLSVQPATAEEAGYDFVLSWGSLGSGEGEFNAIHEVAAAPNGSVYTVETGNQRVQNFSPEGTFRLMWGNPGPGGSSEPGEFTIPKDVAVGWDSRVYVADVGNHRIQWFTPEGVLGGAWGSEGTGDGQFEYAEDIATAPDGTVYVADFNNGRIQRFTRDGGLLSIWSADFDWLTGIAVAPDGTVYVVEQDAQRVQRFTPDGQLIGSWGSQGTGPGQFLSPSAIDIGPDGSVFVADADRDDVQVFSSAGDYRTSFGQGRLQGPSGLAVDRFGEVYVVDGLAESVLRFVSADATGDTDGDALPDRWEILGYDHDDDGSIDVDLPKMGANAYRKDVFVEIDWMTNHRLDNAAIAQVVEAFANAPVPNPNRTSGITLHVDNGSDSPMSGTRTWGARSDSDQLRHVNNLLVWRGVDSGKSSVFAAARRPIFHWVVSAHSYNSTTSSGISRGIPASDLVVSLGAFCASGLDCSGTTAEQAGTFMHELGHNLGLHHGGGDDTNRKPNHLSIMNYAFQLAGLVRDGQAGVFDYSLFPGGFQTLPDLDETSLSESAGFGATGSLLTRYTTTWRCPSDWTTGPVSGALDLDCDGTAGETVSVDLNSDGSKSTLSPWNDWDHIVFDGGQVGDTAGVALPSAIWPKEPSAKVLRTTQKVLMGDAKRPRVKVRVRSRGRVVVTARDAKGLDRVVVKVDKKTRNYRAHSAKVKRVRFQVKPGTHRIRAGALDRAGNSSRVIRRTVRR